MQKYSLLLALVASLLGSSQAGPCYRNDEHFIGGRCYQLVNQKLSFEDARYWCRYQNPSTFSYLATVPDQTTANFLASYAVTTFGNDNNIWIGLSRPTGKYQWDSGYPVGWTNFAVQNSGVYVAESPKNGKWSTFGADAKFNFVCSYDPTAPYTSHPTSTTTSPNPTTSTEWSTTSEHSPCTPSDRFVILYAYSNDMDFYTVNETLFQIIENTNAFWPRWSKMANIRFDVINEEQIQFHNTLESFKSSVLSRMPDPSLGFKSSNTGSDALNVIRKLLSNTVTSPCGAKALFLLKRYSNESDVSSLVADVQYEQVFVQTVAANHTSGGLNHQAMYEVSSKSNGVYVTSDDSRDYNFWFNADSINGHDFLFLNYKQNPKVTGSMGTMELKQFYVPSHFNSDDVYCEINIQKDGMNMQQLNDFTLKFTDQNGTVKYQTNQTLTGWWWTMRGTLSGGHLGMSSDVTSYRVWLDYNYSESVVKEWIIRCFVRSPPSVWPTF